MTLPPEVGLVSAEETLGFIIGFLAGLAMGYGLATLLTKQPQASADWNRAGAASVT